ncbi:unnamed protein product [Victoria cruziana]
MVEHDNGQHKEEILVESWQETTQQEEKQGMKVHDTALAENTQTTFLFDYLLHSKSNTWVHKKYEEQLTKKKGSKWRWWNRSSLFFCKTKWLEPQMTLSSSLPTKAVRAYSSPIYGAGELLPSRKSFPLTPVRRGGRGEDVELFNIHLL